LSEADWQALEGCYSCGVGTCNTMGTASTMTALSEALGMMLPGTATIPASDTRRLEAAEQSGRRAVELVREDLRPAAIMTRRAFENALRVYIAIGGSTNAVIHLLAIAGRLRVPLTLDDFDWIARETPVLLDLQPTGTRLMGDFDAAGGLPRLMGELRNLLHLDARSVSGRSLGDHLPMVGQVGQEPSSVVRSRTTPLHAVGGLAIVHGNIAPDGAVVRTTTASPTLLQHRGPALVFDSYAEMLERIDNADLPVTPDSVLILRNVGAVGAPGMPEWGAIPVPKKLLLQGIRDIVRLSDARMSGTSSGTVVLHIAPEAAIGGPLALVRDGDLIELDLANRRLTLVVSAAELEHRRSDWQPPARKHSRGYLRLYEAHVLQPDQGCDFDFLRPQTDADLVFVPPIVGRS
jgi:dihydroxy-acid dehydratase